MSVITVTFYDGETGEQLPAPKDFSLNLYMPGSEELKEVEPVDNGLKYIVLASPGVYTAQFVTESLIASLDPEIPGDIAYMVLDGNDARAYFNVYLWEIQPDGSASPEVEPKLELPCPYCDERYSTVSSPYYHNMTWWQTCRTSPPCTQ